MELNEQREYVKTVFHEAGLEVSELQVDQFLQYFEMLVKKNEVMNLTAITEFKEVIIKHFADSCMYVPEGKFSLIDVGTGAGFPGIPLKIMNPELEVTLLDSLQKRLNFLNEVTSALELKDIDTVHSRAEDGAKSSLRESFDLAVSRAVANLSTLLEYCLPYVKKGGAFIAYKSGAVDEEIEKAAKALKVLGGQIEEVRRFHLPEIGDERTIVIIRKVAKTPGKYPRKAGIPSKEPL